MTPAEALAVIADRGEIVRPWEEEECGARGPLDTICRLSFAHLEEDLPLQHRGWTSSGTFAWPVGWRSREEQAATLLLLLELAELPEDSELHTGWTAAAAVARHTFARPRTPGDLFSS